MNGMLSIDLPGIKKLRSGKVREVFDLEDTLLIVATDRISAFDCIFPDPIPQKGEVLTQLSAFWFKKFQQFPNHFLTYDDQESGTVCGINLPVGLKQAARLPEPIFTPAIKAESGHDENISWPRCCEILGPENAIIVRDRSLAIYSQGSSHAASRGIIIADTKFEFGLQNNEILLIDECLTPDSSRFWPADSYEIGASPFSFDNQFVRDYLETLEWVKTPPAPTLPPEIIEKTARKYQEAFSRLAG